MEPRYPLVVVDLRHGGAAEETARELFDLGAQAVEERDSTTLVKGIDGGVTLVASFATHEEARAASAALGPERGAHVEEVVGDAWRDEWKKYFHAFELCPGLVVRPPWEADAGAGGVLILEPGRAFGTGLHETTSLVARV